MEGLSTGDIRQPAIQNNSGKASSAIYLQPHHMRALASNRKCIDVVVIKGQSLLSDGGSWRKKLCLVGGEIFILRRRVNIEETALGEAQNRNCCSPYTSEAVVKGVCIICSLRAHS